MELEPLFDLENLRKMPPTLSKTIDIEPTTDILKLHEAFKPVAYDFALALQSNSCVGRRLKIGIREGKDWKGTEIEFIVWQYKKLIDQIGGNLAVVIEWEKAEAIHLSVSDIVEKDAVPHLGAADIINS